MTVNLIQLHFKFHDKQRGTERSSSEPLELSDISKKKKSCQNESFHFYALGDLIYKMICKDLMSNTQNCQCFTEISHYIWMFRAPCWQKKSSQEKIHELQKLL